MINISRVWCGVRSNSDGLRYGEARKVAALPSEPENAAARRPVVVWNITRTCNLRCIHCYSDSDARRYPGELEREEISAFLKDLAQFQVPALLLSGGEPMVHPDFWSIASYARTLGLRLTLSTNGTRIGRMEAKMLKQLDFTYVGISLDGIGEINDMFRGKAGAFKKAAEAFQHCLMVGQRAGLRMTLTRHNIESLPEIFNFIEAQGIPRVCFYHLVYTGRGNPSDDVSHEMTRKAIDLICKKAAEFAHRGLPLEILTVANGADAAYLLLKAEREKHPQLGEIRRLLRWNAGNHFSTGTGIANVDFVGNVHPDQFWRNINLGNIREEPFSRIWSSQTNELLNELRNRTCDQFTGRCRECRWFGVCGGGLRARAQQTTGQSWADDPACYLTDEEIRSEVCST